MAPFGTFVPNVGSKTINISTALLQDFESGKASAKLLEATVLHELVHYFDDQDGVDYPGEEGNLFEQQCYGGVVKK